MNFAQLTDVQEKILALAHTNKSRAIAGLPGKRTTRLHYTVNGDHLVVQISGRQLHALISKGYIRATVVSTVFSITEKGRSYFSKTNQAELDRLLLGTQKLLL